MRLVIPSIDISGGFAVKRVRGVKGSELAKLSIDDAIKLVKDYPLVHVVDLDGAELGRPVNIDHIARIGSAVNGRCQVGGGIRDVGSAYGLLRHCSRVVVSTMAVEEPTRFKLFVREVGWERVVVSIDADGEYVLTRGWRFRAGRINEVVRNLPRVKAVVYTDVGVEGTGAGPRASRELVEALRGVSEEVYYAGGVSDCGDVERLWGLGFDGVVIGYALYVRKVRCG